MSKFLCTSQSKCSSSPTCLSFRKSSESFRSHNRNRDVDSEARRKAAAWVWHERAGGEVIPTRPRGFETSVATPRHSAVIPTRPTGVETTATAARHSRADTPTSSLNGERTTDTGARELSSNTTANALGTTLFDASELSSLAHQIGQFAQRLHEESVSDNFRAQVGNSDKLNWRAVDYIPPTATDQTTSEKPFTRHRRSFSDPSVPRPVIQEARGALGTERNVGYPESKAKADFSRTGFAFGKGSKKPSLRKSLFLIQKLCRKMLIPKDDESLDWDRSVRAQSHHHFHHHYHFYHYPPDPDEELRIPEKLEGRRHSETFTTNTGRRFAEAERLRNAADIAAEYWASVGRDQLAASRGGKAEIHDWDHCFSSDESLHSTAKISRDRALRRRSENFDRRAGRDNLHGSEDPEPPLIRRHSVEIGPSHRSYWAGNL